MKVMMIFIFQEMLASSEFYFRMESVLHVYSDKSLHLLCILQTSDSPLPSAHRHHVTSCSHNTRIILYPLSCKEEGYCKNLSLLLGAEKFPVFSLPCLQDLTNPESLCNIS